MIGISLNHYQITSPLGAGGMGEVYRARDTKLGRDVAVKVLPKEFARDETRLRRFELEARALAALNHPNILVVHDTGLHDGTPYLVSELLEGSSLHETLRDGALSQRKAAEYGLQMAQGLQSAHDKGVVHRDLKPENLFVTRDGRVKILDFGLAKLKTPSSANPNSNTSANLDAATVTAVEMTQPGTVLGTPAYMSPEQVRGNPTDTRSDIFAFGAIFYEMLSGRKAFRRGTAVETMSAILTEDPPDLSTAVPAISPVLERLVRRCLEKDPARRFQSTSDLVFALENTVLRHDPPTRPGAGELPETASLVEDISAQRPPEGTAPRPSTLSGWLPAKPRPRLAFTVAVLALTAGLIWLVVHRLDLFRFGRAANSAKAQSLYERGNYFVSIGDYASLANAIAKFQEATNADPKFAKAYAALGGAYNSIGLTYEPNKGWDAKAFDAVSTALELDPHLPEGLMIRGDMYFAPLHLWDAEKALEDYNEVVKGNHDREHAYIQSAFVYFHLGLLDEAIEALNKAHSINSASNYKVFMGQTLVYQGSYEKALENFNAVPDELYGGLKFVGGFKGICLFYLGQTNELALLLTNPLKKEPGEPLMTSLQAMLLASAGDTNQAKEKIQVALAGTGQFVHFHHVNYQIGAAYALMHEPKLALDYIRRAANNGFPCYPYFTNDPSLKNLQNDQNFQEFLQEQKRDWEKRKKELAQFLN